MEHPNIPWKDALRNVVAWYNDTSHSSLKGKNPDQAYEDIRFCIDLYEKARNTTRK